jgi:MinD-like ATPase involved in chromosome partitioning or flagellar assembly
MIVPEGDTEYIQRAMLAGARGTINRTGSLKELSAVIDRICESGASTSSDDGLASLPAKEKLGAGKNGVIVPVFGARGGAGKSTLSSMLAWLASSQGIDTALVDFDLQFGDLAFLFGAKTSTDDGTKASLSSLFEAANKAQDMSKQDVYAVNDCLSLYPHSPNPYCIEKYGKNLSSVLEHLSQSHELVLINTGSFWTFLHSELYELSNVSICVCDQSLPGMHKTKVLRDAISSLGLPLSKLLYLGNFYEGSDAAAEGFEDILQSQSVYMISQLDEQLRFSLEEGRFQEVLSSSSLSVELFKVLDEIATRSDLVLRGVAPMRFSMRRDASSSLATKGIMRSRKKWRRNAS